MAHLPSPAVPSSRTRLSMVALATVATVASVASFAVADSSAHAATKTTVKAAAKKATVKAAAKKTAAAAAVIPTTFPSVKVIDLATTMAVDLAALNVTTKPQLVWFWAPT